ncbi:acyltransferase family protein [Nocardioides zeicaulis]
MQVTRDTIGSRFDHGPNALSFLRLLLAAEVVAWHSYALRGDTWLPERLATVVGDIGVDAFFALSGFLVCRAWVGRSGTRAFVLARARRIFPGLWTCLLVTAFVIAPLASAVAGMPQLTLAGQLQYVWSHADTWATQGEIDGTPVGTADRGWNGSLWTLGYEVACYVVIVASGAARVLRPGVLAALAFLFWTVSLELALTVPGGGSWAPPRFGLMFTLGALLWMQRDRIPFSRLWCALATVCIVVGAFTPDYRVMAAPAVAYLCIVGGTALGRYELLVLRHDLSYGTYIYAFPIQQAFLMCGVTLTWVGFVSLSLATVLPVAAVSWYVVERPALPRDRRRDPSPAGSYVPAAS